MHNVYECLYKPYVILLWFNLHVVLCNMWFKIIPHIHVHRVVEMLKDKKECSLPEEIPCYLLSQGKAMPFWRIWIQFCTNCVGNLFKHTYFTLCSAKTRDGVQEAFEELVHKILQTPGLYTTDSAQPSQGFGLANNSDSQTSEGCMCTLT